jgi:hypothetical protein
MVRLRLCYLPTACIGAYATGSICRSVWFSFDWYYGWVSRDIASKQSLRSVVGLSIKKPFRHDMFRYWIDRPRFQHILKRAKGNLVSGLLSFPGI